MGFWGRAYTRPREHVHLFTTENNTAIHSKKKKYTAIEIDDSILEIGGHKYKPLFRG